MEATSRTVNGEIVQTPRIAGISSFGAGGANAHLIIEEYRPALQRKSDKGVPYSNLPQVIITLSARTGEQLDEIVVRLLHWIQNSSDKTDLHEIAHTLQTGRVAMEERLGLLVSSVKELEEKLEQYQAGEEGITGIYRGQVKKNRETLSVIMTDEDMKQTIELWITKKKYSKILDLWVKGLVFEWNKLYGESKPKRISLPTYPFARERYWIKEDKGIVKESEGLVHKHINPLLHQNTSTLEEERFTSTFTGEEFFLNDHKVNGEKLLPGVVYLEMARTAVEKASGKLEEGKVIHLKDVVWFQPIVFNGSVQKVHIGVFEENDGEIQYEVYTESENREELKVHFRGIAKFKASEENPVLDIKNLQSEMNKGLLNPETCYQTFQVMGIDYGEGYRGIKKIYQGEGQLLAELYIPSTVHDTLDEYLLHLSLMDAALQSSIGLVLNNGESVDGNEVQLKASLPYVLKSLEVLGLCSSEMYAWVRYSDGSTLSDKVQKLDIDLCDEQGNICVKMRGLDLFTSITHAIVPSVASSRPEMTETSWNGMAYIPKWEEVPFKTEKSMSIHKVILVICHEDSHQFENTIRYYYERGKTSKVIVIRLADRTKQVSEHEWFCDIHDKAGFQTCLEKIQ